MGHKVKRKSYKLKFADGSELDGAEVIFGSINTDQFLVLSKGQQSDKGEESFEEMIDLAASKLRSWDLEEEDADDGTPGAPIPATREGFGTLEINMILAIIQAWTEAMVQVAPPLPAGSDSSVTSLEASIPMTPLDSSMSLAS